jgi:hypothetical protein
MTCHARLEWWRQALDRALQKIAVLHDAAVQKFSAATIL